MRNISQQLFGWMSKLFLFVLGDRGTRQATLANPRIVVGRELPPDIHHKNSLKNGI